jgi:hypothetical protein
MSQFSNILYIAKPGQACENMHNTKVIRYVVMQCLVFCEVLLCVCSYLRGLGDWDMKGSMVTEVTSLSHLVSQSHIPWHTKCMVPIHWTKHFSRYWKHCKEIRVGDSSPDIYHLAVVKKKILSRDPPCYTVSWAHLSTSGCFIISWYFLKILILSFDTGTRTWNKNLFFMNLGNLSIE